MDMKLLGRWVSAGALVGAIGCGGSSGNGNADAGTTMVQVQPTLSSIQQNIFSIGCATSSCHSPTGQAGVLDLTAGHSYAQLLGPNGMGAPIPDSTDPGEKQAASDGYLLVSPGHPEKSFLLLKITPGLDTNKYGLQMPNVGSILTTQEVQAVHDWIAAGAQNN